MSPTAETLLLIFLAICVIYTLINGTSDIIEFVSTVRWKLNQLRKRPMIFHSPEPWTVERAGSFGEHQEYTNFCIISEGVIIADVYAHALPDHHLPSRVNARLIAAAPTMFRLLQGANAALTEHPDGDTRSADHIDATAALLRQVQYGN